ncbi:MAG: hypothetical protein E7632_00930, partial [Ruminococcaceae bacterium]|nr:hypothetical protein [Oscillospiraceae bacterium]
MTPFKLAQPIYVKGLAGEMNTLTGYTCAIEADAAKSYTLFITGASYYRIYLDGEMLHYGPARGPHGYVRCDTLTLPVKSGRNILAIEVEGCNCPSFYTMDVRPFVQAEVMADGEVIAYTGRDFKAVSLVGLREQKVLRYSYQRAFTEVWRMTSPLADWKNGEYPAAETEISQHGKVYLMRDFAMPDYTFAPDAAWEENGTFRLRGSDAHAKNRFLQPGPDVTSFQPEELADRVLDDTDADFTADDRITGTLTAGQYARFALAHIYTGFIRVKVRVLEPATIHVVFAERIRNGRIDFGNGDCSWLNIIKYELPVGEHMLESFEPYSLKYIGIMVNAGRVEAESAGLRQFAYPAVKPEIRIDDPMLRAAYDAAFEGFRQNTIDCYMDCPGRERGGWLCDSYFTAQASKLFTGSTECERAFLDNFRLPERFPKLPLGLLPMCYPGETLTGNSIPQWTMWYVIEVGGFKARGGDAAPFREVLAKILAFFESYENADGLLEKLPLWNFVEWTRANQWVQDVNYPTNMLYHKVLLVMADILERPELCDKAARVKAEVIRQSYDGKYFHDHAKRGEDGSLTLLDDISAICQHEAALFGVV